MAVFDDLLLNPRTLTDAHVIAKQPPHGLLIVGLPGSGKTAFSHALASKILNTSNLSNYPYFLHVTRPKDKKDIPLENVRQVLHALRLKTPGADGVRRIIFIEDAQYLSNEAQNALLKALEEPAEDTAFILSVSSTRAVLPTIASRAQAINIQPVSLTQAKKFYANRYEGKDIDSAWQLSGGRPALLQALLENSSEHPLKQAVDSAKQLLRQDKYHRLLILDKLSKDKEQFSLTLDALSKVLAALQRVNLKRGIRQGGLLRSRRLVAELSTALTTNSSPRLLALELALKLEV